MIFELSALASECIEMMIENQEMFITSEENLDLENATCCYKCEQALNKNSSQIRDHDHGTGCYRGAAHDRCNIY